MYFLTVHPKASTGEFRATQNSSHYAPDHPLRGPRSCAPCHLRVWYDEGEKSRIAGFESKPKTVPRPGGPSELGLGGEGGNPLSRSRECVDPFIRRGPCGRSLPWEAGVFPDGPLLLPERLRPLSRGRAPALRWTSASRRSGPSRRVVRPRAGRPAFLVLPSRRVESLRLLVESKARPRGRVLYVLPFS